MHRQLLARDLLAVDPQRADATGDDEPDQAEHELQHWTRLHSGGKLVKSEVGSGLMSPRNTPASTSPQSASPSPQSVTRRHRRYLAVGSGLLVLLVVAVVVLAKKCPEEPVPVDSPLPSTTGASGLGGPEVLKTPDSKSERTSDLR